MTRHLRLLRSLLRPLVAVVVIGGVAAAGYFSRDHWLPLLQHDKAGLAEDAPSPEAEAAAPTGKIILSDLAIANLRLSAAPAQPRTYWKTIQVPGMVVDRPGRSDRGVITPLTGVVTRIHHFPGDTVEAGEELFTIQLLSESLHATQSELFKATQEITLVQAQLQRLAAAAGAIPQSRIIEVQNQITRLESAVKATRRELLNRGLLPGQIDEAARGEFVREIAVVVPAPLHDASSLTATPLASQSSGGASQLPQPAFEVQELKVDMGHQVQSGQTLCLLSNHQRLEIEGRAFRDETLLLERSVQQGWPVEVDFQENAAADWPLINQTFHIRYIANSIDPVNRTFGFRVPLENQSREVQNGGRTQLLWRFRPGQKVRVLVRIERVDDVFILPAEAVTRDLAEAFVFTQNVNTFERKPVRIVAQDRQHTVIANDGSLLPGSFVVQNAAAQLNRMTKSKSSDDLPEGYHIHADGSLHKNEDEGN